MKRHNLTPENIFFFLSILNITIMLILIMGSRGQVITTMSYGESRFCDFWAHIGRLLNGDNIYGTDADAIFPPLLYLFMRLFAIPLSNKIDDGGYDLTEISSSGYGGLTLVLYFMLFLLCFLRL